MLNGLLEESQNQNTIPLRLERFEGTFAVLVFESVNKNEQREILWPVQKLPKDIRLGQKVWLQLSTESTREQEKTDILRKLLEKLIS